MPFDAPVVACLAQEIQRLLPVKIDKIHQPERDEFIFGCYGSGESFKILISLNPQYARFHITRTNQPNPIQPSSFCMLLRKYFSGSKLIKIDAVPFERIIKLTFEVYDPVDGLSRKYIWVEFTGKSANLVVCNDKEEVIDTWRHRHVQSGERDVSGGSQYELPPTGGRWQPVTLPLDDFLGLITSIPPEVKVENFFLKHWLGLSLPAVHTFMHAAGIPADSLCAALNREKIISLYDSFNHWAEVVSQGRFQPVEICDENNKPLDFLAFWPGEPGPHRKIQPVDCLNETVANTLGAHHEARRFSERRLNLLHKIHAQLEKNRKKIAKQTAEARQAEQSDKLRINGELLTIYGHQIRKGATEVTLPNYYDPDGNTITIRLNPALTANENAQHYFKKYQKAKKGQLAIAEQIAKTQEVIDYLESLEAMTETATSPEDLDLLHEELDERPNGRPGKSGIKSGKANKPNKPDAPSKPRQFTTPAGHLIWVGRNNLQNDRLTFKMAAPTDFWFHTQKIPGSHVIVKLLPGTEIDNETLNCACQLAVYFSKGRLSTKVPVDYTQRKNVKKPPASKPGFVIYDSFKTAIITPDPEILKRLGVEEIESLEANKGAHHGRTN